MATRTGVEEGNDPELHELSRDVQPEKVLNRLERSEREFLEKE